MIVYRPDELDAIFPDIVPEPETRDVNLESILGGKLKIFSTLIADIDAEAEERRRLSRTIAAEIVRQYGYLKTKLYETDLWPVNASRQVEQRRSSLEKQLDELLKQHRDEQAECWKDLAKLNVERRVWLKQYGEQLNRMRLFSIQ